MDKPPVVSRPVISSQLAYLMTNTLSDEAVSWESLGHPNPLEIGHPAAAKMGHTVYVNDLWTIGFTPQLAVGVWIGNENPDFNFTGEVSPKVAAVLWHAIIQSASQGKVLSDWEIPPGITTALALGILSAR